MIFSGSCFEEVVAQGRYKGCGEALTCNITSEPLNGTEQRQLIMFVADAFFLRE